jgi:glycosyltransferase involved in cell wall biosynthesis
VTNDYPVPLLSIVIPAYRDTFLAETLASVVRAADADTEVVIGDDASPGAISEIVEPFKSQLNLHYHRFEANLGATSLTKQWDRCIALSRGRWLLLLGDDDLIDENYVRAFRKTLAETRGRFDLYRFDNRWIDATGQVIRDGHMHPDLESWHQYVLSRFRGQSSTFTCDHVFSRDAYNRMGGFVDFPLAWCSDDATWVLLGLSSGIKKVNGAKASWRRSGQNISSAIAAFESTKVVSMALYLNWLLSNLPKSHPLAPEELSRLRASGRLWLFHHIWSSRVELSAIELTKIWVNLKVMPMREWIWDGLRLLRHASLTSYGRQKL